MSFLRVRPAIENPKPAGIQNARRESRVLRNGRPKHLKPPNLVSVQNPEYTLNIFETRLNAHILLEITYRSILHETCLPGDHTLYMQIEWAES